MDAGDGCADVDRANFGYADEADGKDEAEMDVVGAVLLNGPAAIPAILILAAPF